MASGRHRSASRHLCSDEDDYSCKGSAWGSAGAQSRLGAIPLERYLELFKDLKANRNIKSRVFPIVGTLEGTCTVSSYGVKYLKVRSQVGGAAASICPAEIKESVMLVANELANMNPVSKPPVFTVDPIVLPDARENMPYTANLIPYVDGTGTFSFTVVSGPSWLAINSSGSIMAHQS